MARFTFGAELYGGVAVPDAGDNNALKVGASVTLTFYDAEGGAPITDFLLWNGSTSTFDISATSITTTMDGYPPRFQGPDGLSELWYLAGSTWLRLEAVDAVSPAASVEWTAITGKPAVIAGGADALEARAAIGAAADAEVVHTDDFDTAFSTAASTYLPLNGYARIELIAEGDPIPTGLDNGTLVVTIPASGAASVTITELAVGGSTTDGTTFSTGSFTTTAGSLVLVYAATGMSTGGSTPATLTSGALSGQGITWTPGGAVSTANGFSATRLWSGVGSGNTGALTIAPGASVEGCVWRVVEITGVSTSVVQVGTAQPSSTSTTPGVVLSSVNGGNVVFGFIVQQNGNALTPGTGFVEVSAQAGISAPTLQHAAEYILVGQNTVSWAGSGTVQRAVIACEVAPL